MKTITYFEPELRASAKLADYGKMVLAFCITGGLMDYQRRWKLFEAAKREISKRNLPAVEYEKEIKKLCRKYRI